MALIDHSTRRALMTQRDMALSAGDIAVFQRLTRQIADLPMKGIKALTAKDIAKYRTGPGSGLRQS